MEYHDNSNCSNDYQFAHELFLYLRYKRYCYRKRSPRLVRKFCYSFVKNTLEVSVTIILFLKIRY